MFRVCETSPELAKKGCIFQLLQMLPPIGFVPILKLQDMAMLCAETIKMYATGNIGCPPPTKQHPKRAMCGKSEARAWRKLHLPIFQAGMAGDQEVAGERMRLTSEEVTEANC